MSPLVRDAMNRKVFAVVPDTPLTCVVRLLETLGAGALPVLDAGGRPVAMVRWVDVVQSPRGCAADIMVPGATTVDAGADLGETAERMAHEGLRRLLVVEDGRLVGMLAPMDCLRALVDRDAKFAQDPQPVRAASER
jgi:IMP dehydrogenase